MEAFHKRSLPHWYMPNAAHFLTYRLAGTLPQSVIGELEAKKQRLLNQPTARSPSDHRKFVHKTIFAAYEKYLDNHRELDWLSNPRVAAMIRQNLYYHDGIKYYLHAYCVMPNHVHVLLTPAKALTVPSLEIASIGESSDHNNPLSEIMHSLKSYTANEANRLLNRKGAFWQSESYDHWVRDDDELERVVNYIRANPVEANIVKRHEDFYWSSCHDRYLFDGDTSAWIPTHNA